METTEHTLIQSFLNSNHKNEIPHARNFKISQPCVLEQHNNPKLSLPTGCEMGKVQALAKPT